MLRVSASSMLAKVVPQRFTEIWRNTERMQNVHDPSSFAGSLKGKIFKRGGRKVRGVTQRVSLRFIAFFIFPLRLKKVAPFES
jgi:hypothetical protein